MIKRLIFDVDGTLIVGKGFFSSTSGKISMGNSIDLAVEKTLKRLNLYSKENVDKFLGAIKTYESKFHNYNKTDYIYHLRDVLGIQLKDDFLDIFFDELQYCIPPKNEKLIDKIMQLSKKYELVLLTNYFSVSQLNRLNNMGIGKFFTECYGEEITKPNLMAYIKACGNNKPNECIMIGDDLSLDVENAIKAGLKAIWVNSQNILNHNIDIKVVKKVEEIDEKLIETIDNNLAVNAY